MKARLKFSKAGTMKFIGHLDVMRYFQKAFRRCGLDVAYSQGFNPHQLISFASPLGVGLTSDGEYLDLQLISCENSETMINRINSAMSDEFQVTEFVELPEHSKPAMSIVAAADYQISLKDGYPLFENMQKQFISFMEQEQIIITKKTKKSTMQIDLKPFIYQYAFTKEVFSEKINHSFSNMAADEYQNGSKLFVQVSAGSVVNIKPEQIMQAFYEFMGQTLNPFSYQYHRLELYADMSTDEEKHDFVPLCTLGTKIE